jgi:hypothetical protein
MNEKRLYRYTTGKSITSNDNIINYRKFEINNKIINYNHSLK